MSESLQGRHTTSNANTWVANSYHILYDKENRCVLSRFLNVDGVGAVQMSRGKLFHAVGPATENAWLPSWRLVRGTRSPRAAERRAERVATVVTSSFIHDGAGAGPYTGHFRDESFQPITWLWY